MGITELIWPSLTSDPSLLLEYKAKVPQALQYFRGAEGLKTVHAGRIVSDGGVSVDAASGRNLLVLEWDDASSFHNFFPNSENFQGFLKIIKPYAAGPAEPQLYETSLSSAPCSASPVAQIIKVVKGSDTEEVWSQVEKTLSGLPGAPKSFFHGSGIEQHEGTFLGMVGWNSLQDYENSRKESAVQDIVNKLSAQGKLVDQAVQLNPVDVQG
jgi:hypothetical protein